MFTKASTLQLTERYFIYFNYVNMCAYMWVYTCETQMPTEAWKGHWVSLQEGHESLVTTEASLPPLWMTSNN